MNNTGTTPIDPPKNLAVQLAYLFIWLPDNTDPSKLADLLKPIVAQEVKRPSFEEFSTTVIALCLKPDDFTNAGEECNRAIIAALSGKLVVTNKNADDSIWEAILSNLPTKTNSNPTQHAAALAAKTLREIVQKIEVDEQNNKDKLLPAEDETTAKTESAPQTPPPPEKPKSRLPSLSSILMGLGVFTLLICWALSMAAATYYTLEGFDVIFPKLTSANASFVQISVGFLSFVLVIISILPNLVSYAKTSNYQKELNKPFPSAQNITRALVITPQTKVQPLALSQHIQQESADMQRFNQQVFNLIAPQQQTGAFVTRLTSLITILLLSGMTYLGFAGQVFEKGSTITESVNLSPFGNLAVYQPWLLVLPAVMVVVLPFFLSYLLLRLQLYFAHLKVKPNSNRSSAADCN
ncbi:hypothetical protein C7N43_26000 [Sphingobacteriales bacterium UPWRP_1]|nr:hypothetical protein BVG80_17805 [Sphingobacteriales bacterium TSM_CSM]PSJ74049.1 hypothetical protein C7N43_26000 [Sphingobacteriales bacterium UPWRP_1]